MINGDMQDDMLYNYEEGDDFEPIDANGDFLNIDEEDQGDGSSKDQYLTKAFPHYEIDDTHY